MTKKDLIATGLLTFSLTVILFQILPISSQGPGDYDPWIDVNDDGKIDMKDIGIVARAFGAAGTPINKTELLLNLQSRVDGLNYSLLELQGKVDDLNASFLSLEAYLTNRIGDLETSYAALQETVNGLETTVAELEAGIALLNATKLHARIYDSDWFYVGTNGDYEKLHNLGTTSLVVSLWFSKTSDGTERCYGPAPLSWREHNPEHVSGVTVAEITSTTIKIRTGNDFRIPSATPGRDANENLSGGYVRIIALAV